MKPDYKNWVPKGMIVGILLGTVAIGILLAIFVFTDLLTDSAKLTVDIILA